MSLIAEVFVVFKKDRFEKLRVIAILLTTIIALVSSFYGNIEKGKYRQKDLTYTQQNEKLEEIQQNINNFSEFVALQKKQLENSQKTIEQLEAERKKLKPLVDADRKTIEAIMQFQEEKSRNSVWLDRFIGFTLGILGSLVASLIVNLIRKRSA